MSSSLDKLLMSMSLEDNDEPFTLPDLPEFSSKETNSLSLIGRILNPDSQKLSSLILDMPRKWQLYDRVRGIALSPERFQFIFKYEHELEDILHKGTHTYNQWALALDRWIEQPPSDYLQFIKIWVQLRNIPVNHFTSEAIRTFAGFAGEVIDLDFDPLKARNRDYVRARIRFDVSQPLRRSKVINLPSGEVISISYDYERIQKRCYFCQRLTHERDNCPFFLKAQQQLQAAEFQHPPLVCDDVSPTPVASTPDSAPKLATKLMSNSTDSSMGRIQLDSSAKEDLRQFVTDSSVPSRFTTPNISYPSCGHLDLVNSSEPLAPLPGLNPFSIATSIPHMNQGSGLSLDNHMDLSTPQLRPAPRMDQSSLPPSDFMLTNTTVSTRLGDSGSQLFNSAASSSRSPPQRSYFRKKTYKPRKPSQGTPPPSPLTLAALSKDLGKRVLNKRKGSAKIGNKSKAAKLTSNKAVPNEGLPNV